MAHLIIEDQDGHRIKVERRMAFVIGALVTSQQKLNLDDCDFGSLTIRWGSGEIRLATEAHHAPIKEPA